MTYLLADELRDYQKKELKDRADSEEWIKDNQVVIQSEIDYIKSLIKKAIINLIKTKAEKTIRSGYPDTINSERVSLSNRDSIKVEYNSSRLIHSYRKALPVYAAYYMISDIVDYFSGQPTSAYLEPTSSGFYNYTVEYNMSTFTIDSSMHHMYNTLLAEVIEDTGLLISGKVSEEGYMYLTWSTEPKVIIGK